MFLRKLGVSGISSNKQKDLSLGDFMSVDHSVGGISSYTNKLSRQAMSHKELTIGDFGNQEASINSSMNKSQKDFSMSDILQQI